MAKKHHDTEESKFIRELRKKNQRLAAENRQLRRENRKLREETVDDPFEEEESLEPESQEKRSSCPKCGAYTKNIFEICEKFYYRCESCGSKGPVTKMK